MKKNVLTIGLFLLSVGVIFAQTQIKPGVGVNTTNITGDGVDASGQIGWQVGASVAFGEKFYFEPGVFYQTNSFEVQPVGNLPVTDATYSGIRIPVAVGLDVLGNADSFAGLRVFGGGSSLIVTGTNSDFLDKDMVESPQWGVFAGVGIDIAIFYLDWTYQWSLNNLQTDIDQIDLGNTRGIFWTAGLRF
ncbi:outer membrane beta-barrel protein [Algoriphagus sediminis]|uniref:Outer membrane beta-barrel protein n=1 Tax=Algoriphagus sediminis TaxID=3057113 RepID=A0ABT7YHG4_9BACT|nr:outer membrane beta-barrel protein [Algoriphagus sediminis]MDN3205968.1 outer membrane beta-barrel protein [Algoriphagus sediminis]